MTTEQVVAELASQARKGGRLAIDTEFVGEGRYHALLCLVQVAVPGTGSDARIEVLDPLEGDLDPAPLAAVLADPEIAVVMHAGRQDVALLRREWGMEVTNLLDTQVAAAFAGLGAQLGYSALVRSALGRQIDSAEGFTRWDRRPLTPDQLSYAREDVRDLLDVAAELEQRLRKSGRWEWAREECRPLERSSDTRDADDAFRRLKGAGKLGPRARAIAHELTSWREATALAEDKPVGTVLGDPVLVEVARRAPRDIRQLEALRGVHKGISRKRGADLIAAVERGAGAPEMPAEKAGPRPGREEVPIVAMCEALARLRASEAGLAYELIATRDQLSRLVTAVRAGLPEPEIRVLSGWRRELIGNELLELIAGRVALRVGADGLVSAPANGA